MDKKTVLHAPAAPPAITELLRALVDSTRKPDEQGFDNIEAQIQWSGEKITLPEHPEHMSPTKAIEWLERFEEIENETVAVHEPINCFPWDGAVAFMKALKEVYGWAKPVPTPGFFGPNPPSMVSVDIGPNERTTVLWGRFQVPGLDGYLATGAAKVAGKLSFVIGGEVKKKQLPAVHRIAELTREIMSRESIYRGKALRLPTTDEGELNLSDAPKFMDTRGVSEDEMVFAEDLMVQVRTSLFTPIEHTATCRTHRIPLKRGILLEGPFGTGKTLCASVTAKKCQENGWTFLTVERVTALKGALEFAQIYQPCCVFVEDIDREVHGERTPEIDDILNTVDGIVSKGTEIMVVMTSNAAELINRAMLRPGRLDAVLHIGAPDADAAEKLMRIYGRGLIGAGVELPTAKVELAGQIPAVIREAVERAKLYAISRAEGKDFAISDDDIANAARGMQRHLELLRGPEPDAPSAETRLGRAVAEIVSQRLEEIRSEVSEIHESVIG